MIALGIIAALLLLIALLPVGVWIRYTQEDYFIRALAGPIRISILEKEPKRRKKPQKKEKAQKTRQKKEKKKKPAGEKRPGGVSDFLPFVRIVLELLSDLRRKLVMHEADLIVTLGSNDAAKTALHYGRACAAVGALTALLQQNFKIKKQTIAVQPDFFSEQVGVYLNLRFTISLGGLLGLILRHGMRALGLYRRLKKQTAQQSVLN